MSAPPQKCPPAPVRITTRTSPRRAKSAIDLAQATPHRERHGVALPGPVQRHHGDARRVHLHQDIGVVPSCTSAMPPRACITAERAKRRPAATVAINSRERRPMAGSLEGLRCWT